MGEQTSDIMGVFFNSLLSFGVSYGVVFVLSFFFESFSNVLYKIHLFRLGLFHLLFSSDKKWKKTGDPSNVTKMKSKTLVFVRHGESAWNVVFNKGFGPSFPGRLFGAILSETQMLPTLDSVFFDSPMSKLGTQQALELQKYVESNPLLSNKDEGKSVVVSSNMRRAISTGVIGFKERFNRENEKMLILSCLQEVTFNVDGVSLAKPYTPPVLADVEVKALGLRVPSEVDHYLDSSENHGDKPVRSQGLKRMLEFCKWCMMRDEQTIITAGHSLYFRFFFQTFLPAHSKHEAKTSKMQNAAVVQFTLWEGPEGYLIEEDSVKVLHNDFESKSKKK